MESGDRISAIESSIEKLRKAYNSVKSDLAVVERRRKKIKRKEREKAEAAAEKKSSSAAGINYICTIKLRCFTN